MVYTAPDGVTAPAGADAFNPPVQHKATVDGGVPYHNRRIYADATAMNAETRMVKGWEAYTTDDGRKYEYDGTAWARQATPAYAEAGGIATTASVAGSGSSAPIYWSGEEVVTFPVGMFSLPPIVTAVPYNISASIFPGMHVSDITSTGFKYRLMRIGAVPATGSKIMWHARQATATVAAG